MKNYRLLMLLSLLVATCQQAPANQEEPVRAKTSDQIAALTMMNAAQGNSLLQTQCYNCHDPASGDHDNMLAPPLAGIKYRYSTLYPERDVFIQRMSDFVAHPTEDNAVMRGPVRRFGLMPPSALKQDTILALVAYIYDHKLPVPDWFPEHFKDHHGKAWQE